MKNKLGTRLLGLLLCVCMLIPMLTACGNQDKTQYKDTLTVYMLGEGAHLPYDAYTTYSVKDDSIVMVSEEGFVSALNVGETVVTVNGRNTSDNYKIVVEDLRDEDEKRFGNFTNIDDSTAYIGAGINLLTSGNPSSTDCILTHPILDADKVAASGKLKLSNENTVHTMTISGDSMSSFTDDYTTKIKVGGSAKYGKLFSASIDTDFSSTASIKNTTQTNYLKFYSSVEKMTLNLCASTKELKAMLSEEFVEDLFGLGSQVLTPEEVIGKYGSHLILSAVYGGRMDFTYFLSSTESSTTASDMKNVSAKVSLAISNFSADANGSYSSDAKKTASSKNISIYESSNVVGGKTLDMSSTDAMRANYQTWLSSLSDDANYSMIGLVNENSLLEIWSFLPDGARKNEFISYFARTANDSYNNLLSKYSRTSTQTVSINYGEYPQSEASLTVAKALDAGEGTAIGTFITNNDVILYNNTRYLRYVPTVSVNSYQVGKAYYFKFEPISWQYYATDTNGQKLYTTTSIIDCQKWYDTSKDAQSGPYSQLSLEQKLNLCKELIAESMFEFLEMNYYTDAYGDSDDCGNLLEYIKRHYYGAIEEELQWYYNDLLLGSHVIQKEHWETSTLRDFLNDAFVSFAFTDSELDGLGKVHTYATENNLIGPQTRLVMDYVSIAPNMNAGGAGDYYGTTIKATDFAYARGLTDSTPFWASRSNYVDYKVYCNAGWYPKAPGSYTYDATKSNTWQFASVGTDADFGIRATIAIK